MQMTTKSRFGTTVSAVIIFVLLAPFSAQAADDATKIMQQVYDAKQISDEIATLNFHFIAPDNTEKKVVYKMVWKNMRGKDGYDNKAIFFTELPLDKKGIAYLGWLRPHGSDKLNDEWLYLPELRTTRRIAQSLDHEQPDNDEFSASLLDHEQLMRRAPGMDDHTLLEEATFDGRPHYRISSTPRHTGMMMHDSEHEHGKPTARRINWVDRESMLLDRVQFLDNQDKVQLDMKIDWQQVKGYWIWKRIEAVEPSSGKKTLLDITDIRVNSGLSDHVFRKRILEKGPHIFE